MSAAREQRRAARRALHADRAVPAYYIATVGATPVQVSVRLWTEFAYRGRPAVRMAQEYAERQEAVPKLIFSADEIQFIRVAAIVSVEAGEAYRIEVVHPRDDTTITADVSRMTAAEAAGLPVVPSVSTAFDSLVDYDGDGDDESGES